MLSSRKGSEEVVDATTAKSVGVWTAAIPNSKIVGKSTAATATAAPVSASAFEKWLPV